MQAEAVGVEHAILRWPWRAKSVWEALQLALGALLSHDEDKLSEEPGRAGTTADREEAGVAREVDAGALARAQRGDQRAFREIVNHYEERLRVLAFHLLRDAEQMNDALQDTFTKAYAALPGFRAEAALGTWLYRICYRVCLDYLRSRQVRLTTELVDAEIADPADESERFALRDEIALALGTLSVEQRAVLLLVDRDGYDYAGVAAALDVPVGTVASRLSAARAAMRRELRPEAADGEEGR